MDQDTLWPLVISGFIVFFIIAFFVARCLTQGKSCQSHHRLDGKCVVITGADTPAGVELVRELCKRGASKVIMACEDVELGQVNAVERRCQHIEVIFLPIASKDVAVEIRGETNGDIIVEYCDMAW